MEHSDLRWPPSQLDKDRAGESSTSSDSAPFYRYLAPTSRMSDSQALRKLLKSNLTIPTMPAIVQKISALIRDPKTGTREIGSLVAEDAPLAAKVLRIANSAYYGLAHECLSTEHASTILGLNVLKNIVTQVSVITQFENLEKETGFDVSKIWRRSSLTAQIAERMAPLCKKVRVLSPDEFYVCGLLHKVGQVVMLDSIGKPYAQLLQVASHNPSCTQLLETKKLGFNHQEVGALVAKRWDLPEAVVDAIQFHGQPLEALGPRLHVHLITVASQAAKRLMDGDSEGATAVLLHAADALGMDTQAAAGLIDKVNLEDELA